MEPDAPLSQRIKSMRDDFREQGLTGTEAAVAAAKKAAEHKQDIFGDVPDSEMFSLIYQHFLFSEARKGLGQYLTPLPVADMIAAVAGKLAAPGDSCADPFCGSGILLSRMAAQREDMELFGADINSAICGIAEQMFRLASIPAKLEVQDTFAAWADGTLPEVDVVVTNPPFGQTATSLSLPGLQQKLPPPLLKMKKIPAELLGLEISADILASGGLLAAVLPQSVLTNSNWAAYRQHLFGRASPLGAVSLPEATFGPFRGVAKACVLFARKNPKNSRTQPCEDEFPYFRSVSVGYDETGRTSTRSSDMADAASAMLGSEATAAKMKVSACGKSHIVDSSFGSLGETVKLGDIAEIFCGKTPPRNGYSEIGPFLLKVGNLRGGFVSWEDRERQRIPEEMFARHRKLHLRPGDICLTAAAHKPRYIARKADILYEIPAEGAMPSAEVMAVRLLPGSPVDAEHLLFWLRSETGYRLMQDMARGATAHLYPSDVREVLVPIEVSDDIREAAAFLREAAALHRKSERAADAARLSAGKHWDRHR